MELTLFLLVTGFIFLGLIVWGSIVLPGEKWQMIAAFPKRKNDNSTWKSTPVTFYGFFSALAYTMATLLYIILSFSIFKDYKTIFLIGAPVLGACIPASRIIAIIVEKKKYTFTIGGASFFGFITAPLWILLLARLSSDSLLQFNIFGAMSALVIAYTFGEGLGRLACISFGCCYGKPVKDMKEPFKSIFKNFNYRYSGHTKKACYESSLENEPLFPVQGITAFLYIITGLVSIFFFFSGNHILSFILPLIITQLWRVYSETLRCDFRGEHKKLSAYQLMALSTIPYAIILAFVIPSYEAGKPDLLKGLSGLWEPESLLFLQSLFIFSFWFTGRSDVTEATIEFIVAEDKI